MSPERNGRHGSEEELSPLLVQAVDDPEYLGSQAALPSNPLPRAQLATIYTIKLILPVSSTQIMPYVNRMIEGLNLPGGRSSVGYYSGLLSLSHSIGQFSSVFVWGRVSDWIGRIPVIATGMVLLAVSTLWFGLSKAFVSALASRFLNGIAGGIVGVIHSVVGELSDATNQSIAFPFYDIISALGYIIGPIIGGTFAEPATHFPHWFDTAFFRTYPYVLPCFIAAVLAIASALLSVFYLRETHPNKALSRLETDNVSPSPRSPPTEENTPPSVRSLLELPVIQALCASQCMLGFLAASFNTVFILMAYAPIDEGGLSMSPRRIAGALSIMGLVSIGLKTSLPIFLRRYDALTVFRFTLRTWPLTFGIMPVMNIIARQAGPERSTSSEALLWIAITIALFLSRIGSVSFSIVMILTKDHTPSPYALGTTNSISELSQMVGVAIGSPFISSLFAFSGTHDIAGGYLWVVVICVLSLLGDYSASRITKYRPGL